MRSPRLARRVFRYELPDFELVRAKRRCLTSAVVQQVVYTPLSLECTPFVFTSLAPLSASAAAVSFAATSSAASARSTRLNSVRSIDHASQLLPLGIIKGWLRRACSTIQIRLALRIL